MSSDNLLIKEFAQKDVKRLRNLYSGKLGDSTLDQVGYTKKQEERKEGDVWEEDGRKWTIKDGIKQNLTALDGIKKFFSMPMLCPSCGNRMKSVLDKKVYPTHGKCFSCLQEYEMKLKLEGKYEEYAMGVMKLNAKTFSAEAKEYIDEVVNQKEEFFTEAGKKETWSGPAYSKVVVDAMKKELDELDDKIENL